MTPRQPSAIASGCSSTSGTTPCPCATWTGISSPTGPPSARSWPRLQDDASHPEPRPVPRPQLLRLLRPQQHPRPLAAPLGHDRRGPVPRRLRIYRAEATQALRAPMPRLSGPGPAVSFLQRRHARHRGERRRHPHRDRHDQTGVGRQLRHRRPPVVRQGLHPVGSSSWRHAASRSCTPHSRPKARISAGLAGAP